MSSKAKIEAIIPFAFRQVAKDWSQMCQMLQSTLSSVLAMSDVSVSKLGHERPENLVLGNRCRWTTVNWNAPNPDDVMEKMNDKGKSSAKGFRLHSLKGWSGSCF